MQDRFDLERYVEAQRPVYDQVCAELGAGRKRTHWMWFIFPQLQGLSSSATARRYAISSIDEARAYLVHRVLGERLRHCTQLVNAVRERSLEDIFGYPDHLKFRSCMTLFAHAADETEPDSVFRAALRKYCAGEGDPLTEARLISRACGTSE